VIDRTLAFESVEEISHNRAVIGPARRRFGGQAIAPEITKPAFFRMKAPETDEFGPGAADGNLGTSRGMRQDLQDVSVLFNGLEQVHKNQAGSGSVNCRMESGV
jgi:hypothetical protein